MDYSKKLTELSQQCAAITKEKGFFDVWQGDEIGLLKHNVLQQYGELAEAYEAKRKGKFYTGTFEKDTFEDELADVCIFGLSCLGYFDHNMNNEYKTDQDTYDSNFVDFYLDMLGMSSNIIYSKESILIYIHFMTFNIIRWCENNNIDILMHIDQKMKYNASREKLHGKKF